MERRFITFEGVRVGLKKFEEVLVGLKDSLVGVYKIDEFLHE